MPGYPGRALNLLGALSRNPALRPSGDGRLVDPQFARDVDQPKVSSMEKIAKGRAHVVDSCATINLSQGRPLRDALTTVAPSATYVGCMTESVTKIHGLANRQPRRPHHIGDWMERRNLKPADLVREIGADKSTVSRWLNGTTPNEEWQEKLAALFHCDREALFRHPDDDWLTKMFRHRSADEMSE